MTDDVTLKAQDIERDIRIAAWNALRAQGVGQERCYPIINGVVKALCPHIEALSKDADVTLKELLIAERDRKVGRGIPAYTSSERAGFDAAIRVMQQVREEER